MWKEVLGAGGLSSALAVLMAGAFHVFPGRFEAAQMKRDMQQHNVRWNILASGNCTSPGIRLRLESAFSFAGR